MSIPPLISPWVFSVIGLFGLLIDIVGAIIIVLPDFPVLRDNLGFVPILNQEYQSYKTFSELVPEARATLYENDCLNHSANGFDELSSFILRKLGESGEPESIVRRPGQSTVQINRVLRPNTDEIPENILNQWIQQEIQDRRRAVDRIYLISGIVLILIGFVLQFVSYLFTNF